MKKLVIALFVLVCLVQLAVPSKMIMDQENVLQAGKEYKFRTAPVDPYDPFRGKYVTLSFEANRYTLANDTTWEKAQDVYVLLGTDSAGYAIISEVRHEAPTETGVDYVLAKVNSAYSDQLNIDYPFERFYMEENKAPEAEKRYREANRRNNTQQEAYAVVYVKEGEAALKDVMIDGVSLRDLAK
ncbi:MAG: hypothetical protein K0S32_2213 [Bacteroidetes bacterium]|jgi:uncharacterized membrane-anchored protein|nr:hypothetical protein [Bacteroidota bacterium]